MCQEKMRKMRMSELHNPWFGVCREEKKYSIVSINLYDDLEVAKEAARKVNYYVDEFEGLRAYVSLLQDGDPENENPTALLDYLEERLGYPPVKKSIKKFGQ